jgi:peroxiredoxin
MNSRPLFYFFHIIFFLLISCGQSSAPLAKITLNTLDGEEINVGSLSKDKVTIFAFISPDCPLCINYTKTLNELLVKFNNNQLQLIIVFPGTLYSPEELIEFENKYNFKHKSLLDEDKKLARTLNATVTPEVALQNQNGEIVYSGAIDNLLYATGKKRMMITEKYLEEAIRNTLAGKPIAIKHTEAFGCLIEL